MNNINPRHYGTFYDALTGETTMRELTPEEIASLPVEELPLGEPE